jgi:hypothetical protein
MISVIRCLALSELSRELDRIHPFAVNMSLRHLAGHRPSEALAEPELCEPVAPSVADACRKRCG